MSCFDVLVDNPETEEELFIPSVVVPHSLWDIPKTVTGIHLDPDISARNVARFKKHLLERFKCMNGTIEYAEEVVRTGEDKQEFATHPEVLSDYMVFKFNGQINLHVFAAAVLVDEFGLKDLLC